MIQGIAPKMALPLCRCPCETVSPFGESLTGSFGEMPSACRLPGEVESAKNAGQQLMKEVLQVNKHLPFLSAEESGWDPLSRVEDAVDSHSIISSMVLWLLRSALLVHPTGRRCSLQHAFLLGSAVSKAEVRSLGSSWRLPRGPLRFIQMCEKLRCGIWVH